jgi:crotonobetainyl-CoA:carnitine CoA-transferase CaiB-like acyl-CoA transferase
MKTNADRRQHRQTIVARIAEILREKPRSHWLALLRGARIPAGPINRVDQVVADEALLARGVFYRAANTGERPVPQVGTGIIVDGISNSPRLMPPRLGAHTDDVLQGLLGIEETELRNLAEKSITKRKSP